MNPENRWGRKSVTLPRDAIEETYAGLFPGKTGMPDMTEINEMIIACNTPDNPEPGGDGSVTPFFRHAF